MDPPLLPTKVREFLNRCIVSKRHAYGDDQLRCTRACLEHKHWRALAAYMPQIIQTLRERLVRDAAACEMPLGRAGLRADLCTGPAAAVGRKMRAWRAQYTSAGQYWKCTAHRNQPGWVVQQADGVTRDYTCRGAVCERHRWYAEPDAPLLYEPRNHITQSVLLLHFGACTAQRVAALDDCTAALLAHLMHPHDNTEPHRAVRELLCYLPKGLCFRDAWCTRTLEDDDDDASTESMTV